VRAILRLVLGLLVAYVAVAAAAFAFQRQLIHLPDTSTPAAPPDVEEVTYRTDDGLELAAWFVAAEDPISTVLVAPGNAGNRGLRLPLARGLVERGHAVLLVEHRGYGGNPGRPSEAGLHADVLAARTHLEDRGDVEEDAIVHLGESLGSAVVAGLSVEREPAALVLRSPFPELADVARRQLPFLPVRTLLRDRFRTATHLEQVAAPTLVVAGDADRTVPHELSAEVASVAGAELVTVPDADHNDRELLSGATYLDAVDAFVRDAVG
jgi:uncharacterized protein